MRLAARQFNNIIILQWLCLKTTYTDLTYFSSWDASCEKFELAWVTLLADQSLLSLLSLLVALSLLFFILVIIRVTIIIIVIYYARALALHRLGSPLASTEGAVSQGGLLSYYNGYQYYYYYVYYYALSLLLITMFIDISMPTPGQGKTSPPSPFRR